MLPPRTAATAVTADQAAALVQQVYGLQGVVVSLPGERDRNFRITTHSASYLLKIHEADAEQDVLDLQNEALRHVSHRDDAIDVPQPVPSDDGWEIARMTLDDGTTRFVRLLTWLRGDVWADHPPRDPSSYTSLGAAVARLDRALSDFRHPAMHRHYPWGMQYAAEHRQFLPLVDDEGIRRIVGQILDRFERDVGGRLATCRSQVIHNDASDRNILLGVDGTVVGLIDFGDLMHAPAVSGLAVACAYAMLGRRQPVGAILPLVAAYDEVTPLSALELELLFDLIRTRLAMSVCMAARQSSQVPNNDYLRISQADVSSLLHFLEKENRHQVHFTLRDACGREPNPTTRSVLQWMERESEGFASLTRHDLTTAATITFDFTPGSEESNQLEALPSVTAVTDYLFARMREADAPVGLGRYLEHRAWYRAPQFALPGSDERRTVHLAVDLFLPVGEPIYAPLPGVVHARANKARDGDYGPVIMLEHATDTGVPFWTLYGHLSLESLEGIAEGAPVERGQPIGWVGDPSVNGNWAPHLHFQLLTHTLDRGCDIDGVAALSALNVWESVSPDPNLILGIPAGCRARSPRDRAYDLLERRRHLGPSLSLSYGRPLKLVRGEGQYLFDEDGRAYLDMVNNVCHVGHCHPRVVRAGQEQMARLNTNTRYLYEPLSAYVRRLVAIFPEPLNVCYLVNSGSEANDLALRMARAHTGRRGVVVLDHAYHGHLTSLIEISPYKFRGPGGEDPPSYVAVSTMPDGYRGPFRYADRDYGQLYAEDVVSTIDSLHAEGWGLAAFLAESALSCGGQVMLPPGYLAEVYTRVRASGGVCIADEVQIGLGRVGTHMWGFETQGVVPDIVTLGKPLGNGHPLAAVITTRAIAQSFANGMEYFNTFGGNPVSAAIGLAVLDVLRDERLQQNALRMGARFMDGLRTLAQRQPLIGDVRGLGLFVGIELVRDRRSLEPADMEAKAIVEGAKARGVLLSIDGPYHNVLKIKPPMGIREQDCDLCLAVLGDVLSEVGSDAHDG